MTIMHFRRLRCAMKIFLPVALCIVSLFFDGCLLRESEQQRLSGITSVQLAAMGNMTIEVGENESLNIKAAANLMRHLRTEVKNGALIIDQDNLDWRSQISAFPMSANYLLIVRGLDSITISSNGNIQIPKLNSKRFSINIASTGNVKIGDLNAETLNLKISSSGNMKINDLQANALEADLSSAGGCDIKGGEVKTQNIVIHSSGDYSAENLKSDVTKAVLNSTGSATIQVRNQLSVRLSSSGNLRYKGNPIVDKKRGRTTGDAIKIGL